MINDDQTIPEAIRQPDLDALLERIEEESRVHEWRTEQLRRLGISRYLAEAIAGDVDWHAISALVKQGCPPHLALDIVG
jgi:hypothetical protein